MKVTYEKWRLIELCESVVSAVNDYKSYVTEQERQRFQKEVTDFNNQPWIRRLFARKPIDRLGLLESEDYSMYSLSDTVSIYGYVVGLKSRLNLFDDEKEVAEDMLAALVDSTDVELSIDYDLIASLKVAVEC